MSVSREDFNQILGQAASNMARQNIDDNRDRELLEAAAAGDIESVKALVNDGANINVAYKIYDEDELFHTPIRMAALNGHTEVVQYLIDHEAVITPTNPLISSPLRSAAGMGHAHIVKILLDAGHYINHANIRSETALMIAVEYNHLEVVKVLVEAGADIERYNNNGYTPLMVAAKRGLDAVVSYLLANHARVNATSETRLCALSIAAIKGMTTTIRILHQHGADIELPDNQQLTPVMLAASWGQAESVKTLQELGASLESKDKKGRTALDHAYENCYWDVVNLLKNSFQYRLEKIGYDGEIPHELRCPISMEILNEPVTVSSGHTFDRSTLINLFRANKYPDETACPLTRKMIKQSEIHNNSDPDLIAKLEAFVSKCENEAKSQLSADAPVSTTPFGLFTTPAPNPADEQKQLPKPGNN